MSLIPERGSGCDKARGVTFALQDIVRRRAQMEREGFSVARHAPTMASERAGFLELGSVRVPSLTVTPISLISDIPHLFVHGGAWCLGSSRTSLGLMRRMAHQCCRPIVAVDYPLSPKHPYPAAIEAIAEALSSLASGSGIAGIIAGSAGCHIALAALMRLERSGSPNVPGGVLLWNPALTMNSDSWTHDAFGVGFGLTSAEMNDAYGLYCVPMNDPHRDVASMDLSGLPPVWIACGDRDPLLDDSLRAFASLIRGAGEAHLAIIPGAVHGFMNHWYKDKWADAAVTHALAWLEARCACNATLQSSQ